MVSQLLADATGPLYGQARGDDLSEIIGQCYSPALPPHVNW
jgi:hypothetical protein